MVIHLFVDKKLQQKIIIHFIPTMIDKTLNTIQKVHDDRIEELYKNWTYYGLIINSMCLWGKETITLCVWFTDTKGDIKEKKLNNKNVYTWLRVINYVQLVMWWNQKSMNFDKFSSITTDGTHEMLYLIGIVKITFNIIILYFRRHIVIYIRLIELSNIHGVHFK